MSPRWDHDDLKSPSGPPVRLVVVSGVAVLAFPGARGLWHRGRHTGTGHAVHHARARGLVAYVRGTDDPPGWVAGSAGSR